MDVTDPVSLISQVGFPIFVAIWMLYRSDKREETTQATLNELKTAIVELTKAVSQNEN